MKKEKFPKELQVSGILVKGANHLERNQAYSDVQVANRISFILFYFNWDKFVGFRPQQTGQDV